MLLLFHNRYIRERKRCLFAYLVALSHLSDVRFMPPWHQVDSSGCPYLTNGNNYSARLGMNHLCTPIFLLASQYKMKLHSYQIHCIFIKYTIYMLNESVYIKVNGSYLLLTIQILGPLNWRWNHHLIKIQFIKLAPSSYKTHYRILEPSFNMN